MFDVHHDYEFELNVYYYCYIVLYVHYTKGHSSDSSKFGVSAMYFSFSPFSWPHLDSSSTFHLLFYRLLSLSFHSENDGSLLIVRSSTRHTRMLFGALCWCCCACRSSCWLVCVCMYQLAIIFSLFLLVVDIELWHCSLFNSNDVDHIRSMIRPTIQCLNYVRSMVDSIRTIAVECYFNLEMKTLYC